MCQRLRSTSAPSSPASFSRLRLTSRGGVILVIAAGRFPHSMTLLTPPVECRALRGPRGWLRRHARGGEKRRSVHARVPVSRVGISSTPWHREIKIHSRLLFAHWRMCVKESRERISNGVDIRLNTFDTFQQNQLSRGRQNYRAFLL